MYLLYTEFIHFKYDLEEKIISDAFVRLSERGAKELYLF